MYDITQSAVLLEREIIYVPFSIGGGVAQGYSMLPILFYQSVVR